MSGLAKKIVDSVGGSYSMPIMPRIMWGTLMMAMLICSLGESYGCMAGKFPIPYAVRGRMLTSLITVFMYVGWEARSYMFLILGGLSAVPDFVMSIMVLVQWAGNNGMAAVDAGDPFVMSISPWSNKYNWNIFNMTDDGTLTFAVMSFDGFEAFAMVTALVVDVFAILDMINNALLPMKRRKDRNRQESTTRPLIIEAFGSKDTDNLLARAYMTNGDYVEFEELGEIKDTLWANPNFFKWSDKRAMLAAASMVCAALVYIDYFYTLIGGLAMGSGHLYVFANSHAAIMMMIIYMNISPLSIDNRVHPGSRDSSKDDLGTYFEKLWSKSEARPVFHSMFIVAFTMGLAGSIYTLIRNMDNIYRNSANPCSPTRDSYYWSIITGLVFYPANVQPSNDVGISFSILEGSNDDYNSLTSLTMKRDCYLIATDWLYCIMGVFTFISVVRLLCVPKDNSDDEENESVPMVTEGLEQSRTTPSIKFNNLL